MLSAVNGQVYLGVSEVFRLVVREEQDCTVADTSTDLGAVPALFLLTDEVFVELDASHDLLYWLLLFQKRALCRFIWTSPELVKLDLVLVCFISLGWERHLSLVQLVKHD